MLVVGLGLDVDLFFAAAATTELTILPLLALSFGFFAVELFVVSGDFRNELFIETTSFTVNCGSSVPFDKSAGLSLLLSFDDETLISVGRFVLFASL